MEGARQHDYAFGTFGTKIQMEAEANMIASVRQIEERKHFADKMNGFDKRHLDTQRKRERERENTRKL